MRDFEDEIVADLAETYHILNMRELPLSTLAILVFHLRDNSRLKIKLRGEKTTREILLMAGMVDYLAMIYWSKTKDAEHNRNRPTSIVENLTKRQAESDNKSFATAEEFERERMRIINGY